MYKRLVGDKYTRLDRSALMLIMDKFRLLIISRNYAHEIVIPWVVRLYVEIIHEQRE